MPRKTTGSEGDFYKLRKKTAPESTASEAKAAENPSEIQTDSSDSGDNAGEITEDTADTVETPEVSEDTADTQSTEQQDEAQNTETEVAEPASADENTDSASGDLDLRMKTQQKPPVQKMPQEQLLNIAILQHRMVF